MLKWIAKLLGNSSYEVPAGVPEVWVRHVEELLAPLEKLDSPKLRSGLAHDMLGYVLTGEPMAVLSEVAQGEEVGEQLHLLGYHYGREGQPSELYQHLNDVPASVALRWAHLLAACVTSQKRSCRFQMPQDVVWPEVLLMHSAGCSITGWSSARPEAKHLSAACIERLLIEDGIESSALLVAAFTTPVSSSYGAAHRLLMATDLVGYPDALERHIEAVRPHLLPAQVPQRLHILKMLESAAPPTLDAVASQLCELATANSKQVRLAAEPLLERSGAAVFAPLRQIATDGKPDQRAFALGLTFKLGSARRDEAMVRLARELAAADKAPSVQALTSEWDAAVRAETTEATRYQYELPVIDTSPTANAISEELLSGFWREVNDAVDKANVQSRERHAQAVAKGYNFPHSDTPQYSKADMAALKAYLSSESLTAPKQTGHRQREWIFASAGLQKLVGTGSLSSLAALKLLIFFDLAVNSDGTLMAPAHRAFNALFRQTGHPTLLELSVMMDEAGLSGKALLHGYCHGWGTPFASDWPDEAVWPYFAHHMDWLVQVLLNNPIKSYNFDRKGLFRAIATLPAPPAPAINALFALALGSGKNDRVPAQEALRSHPGKEVRIIEALSDGKAEVRALAAQWLCRLRHAPAIPALEKAVLKEKHDLAKGAMLDALQLMGQPVEKYLNRDALGAEAGKSLAKGLPKELDWFPWAAMPTVRWADGHGEVPAEVLKWMLVQAMKQKQPEPNAVLRKYCAMFNAQDREAFGQFVLESWLHEDVRPIPPEEAMTRAKAAAQSTFGYLSQYPQHFQNDPKLGKSVEELTAYYLPSLMRQPEGSATGSKGLLAVAAACAAERAAAPTQRYLKEWYGSRASQGKALIAMLAWIEHPSATQLMLAIGSRFRTRSFQEEATRQAEALADRKGWTLAELADRTVPSAGFDEDGMLELSYGQRAFQARLLPDFKVDLFNPEGKKIASLPEPRQDDDAELAKQSKKTFSAAKKELKSIVDLQTDRLYEALCTEREWPFADWAAYLQAHPVLRHLVQRLVWLQMDDGRVVQSFRPLDDGTLTDHDDNAVHVPSEARVRLAHDSRMDADEVAAWQQHLVDYEIQPLFQQLGKGTYSLPADKAQAEEIVDFKGHMLEAFALRGRALKLGYARGPAEDGGWFHVYEKRFPTLGLQAVIEFTGNPLPEENRTVALINLSFSSGENAGGWQRSKLALSKVPAVLLSECYNDLRLMASEGSGFDPQWEKKSEY